MIFRTITDDITGANKSVGLFGKTLNDFKGIFNSFKQNGIVSTLLNTPLINIDTDAINDYNNAIKSGMPYEQALADARRTTNAATLALIESSHGAEVQTERVTAAQRASTIAAKAQSAALKAVSIAGNIAMMIAISKAIQLAVSAYDNYVHRLDNAKEALSSSTESYENNKKEIEELQQQIDECAKSIANLEKLEKDGSISIVQQDELDKLRQTNEELQRELLIKQELAKVDARKTADDATKLFNTTVTSEYAGNIYYKSRILGDVSQQQELEFSIEEYKRLAEQQKKNDIAYANGEISLKKYTKTNDELIQGMSDARNRATEMADTINQTGTALQKLEASGETLTSEQQGILEQTDALGNEYSDFIHQIDATANAFDKLDEKQKRVRIKTRIVESGVSESDAQNIVNNFSEKDLDVVGSVKFDFEAPQKSDFDSAEEWGKTYAEKFLESAVEVIESDNNLQNAIDKTAEKMVTSLESLSDGFDKISAIYEDVQNKADFDYGSLIDEDFVNIFKAYTAEYENFVDVISNSPTDIAACQSAFDDLVTAWFNGQEPLKNITEETYALTVKWLEQNGVANANEVATYALAKSKVEAFIAGRDLSQVTDEEIAKFLEENAALGVTQEMFWKLQLEMINASNTKLNFSQQLAALNELAERAGIAAISLSNIGGVQTGNAIADNLINSIANPLGTQFQKAAIANQQKAIQDKINSGVPKISYAPRSSGSSGSGGSSSAKEKYVAEIDKYKNLSEAVEDVQTKIEHLNDVYDHTDDIDEQIALKDKLIGLYQEEKNALSALNNARDKEIADNIQKLRDANFQVDYDPKSDRLKIHNLEHLNELSQDTIKDYEDLIKKTEELNDANKDSAEQWTDLTYKIIDAGDAIKDLETKKYEQYIKDTEHLITLMSNRKDTLGGDIPFYTNMMNAAVERMMKLAKEGYEKNKDEIQDLQRDWMDYYDKRIEREKEILEIQLDDKDGALDAVVDLIDEQIKKLDDELDSMKKLNEERKEALELQKAQAAADRAKDQKVRKVLRYGKGYVYEADEDAIKEAQENLADLKYESKVSSIEKEKEKLEEYKNLWAEIPNLFEKYQNELLAEEILGAGWEQKILDGRLDVYNNFKDSYFDLQQDIFDKTEELNNHMSQEYLDMMEMFQKMAEMAEEPAAEEKKQGKIWYVQKNGQAPSQAQVGDKIVTKGGIYEIAEPNSEGAHYNAASGFWNRKISDYQANVVDGMWGTEVRNANAELSNILGLNTLSNKDIVDAAENQIDEIRNSIIASGALSKYTSENSEVTQDQIRTMFENMDTLDGNSVSVEGNTVKIGDNTYALEDLTDALNNFEIKVDMPQGTPDTSGTFDDSQMSKTDQQYIKQLQSAWNTAKANGDTEMMDKLHAMAEAKRDEYRSGKTPAEDVIYEKSKYDLNNTTKTGGSSHGGEKTSLQREYEWQLSKAKEFGASKEYISKLESAIAREEYGSGHTIDTYKDQYGKTSTIINATDKSEANMSAKDIQQKYNKNLNNNTSSMDKLGRDLGKTSDALSDTSDSMYSVGDTLHDASGNIGTSAKDVVDSNTGLKESLDGVKTAVEGMNVGGSGYGSESTYIGGTRFVTDKSSGKLVAAGDREVGISSNDKVVGTKTWSSGGKTYQTTSYQKPGGKVVTSTKVTSNDKKKKAKGGLNLPPEIYNVDELGKEMIVEPVEQPIQGRYHRMTYGGNVIPADVSEKLWEFGLNPAEFLEKNLSKLVQPNIYPTISPASSNVENHYHVESLALPNVQDVPSFIKNLSMLPNLASQYAARRV